MKDFIIRNKAFLGIVLATILLLIGGIFLFSKNTGPTAPQKVSDAVLIPTDAYKFISSDTPATLVEFGDYQCPACGTYHPLVKQILTDFAGKLNFVFRNYPLPQHSNALISSYAVEAAGLQGKFWEMHDKVYESQSTWSTSTDAKSIFVGFAKDLGLDNTKFNIDIDSQKVKDRVKRDEDDGNLLKINETPTFFLNGVGIGLPGSDAEFKKLIQDAIDKKPGSSGTPTTSYHIHFDLKVYINGIPLNLALSKYQSVEGKELDPNIHLHDGNGKVVHVHKEGIALKELFDSLKVTVPDGTDAYVNGKKVENILTYVPQDLDQILIGSSNISSVSKDACIYSLKCPERGTPPPESCAGGLGTGCTD